MDTNFNLVNVLITATDKKNTLLWCACLKTSTVKSKIKKKKKSVACFLDFCAYFIMIP